ncbi:hypothetical protein ART_3380 [Arthrobacter sp. PAMC 25486]|nr:hypothetical protein ART_3380 [Arthrobacter sp. PAMC 25486]
MAVVPKTDGQVLGCKTCEGFFGCGGMVGWSDWFWRYLAAVVDAGNIGGMVVV